MDDADPLREALYTAVGFGVLGFQQVQLRRRELQKDLVRLAAEWDGKVDPVLDDLVAKLPEDLQPLATQARAAAVSARRSLLGEGP
ncbi:MAG TPA: hypothetical protein VJ653_08500 [Acidimicrobiales bacterium]|nr:hypothetical protein [Acidimicrobiales bacterium]